MAEQGQKMIKLFKLLSTSVAHSTLISILNGSKSVADICLENNSPVSSTYKTIRDMQQLDLVEVDQVVIDEHGKRITFYKAKMKAIKIILDKGGVEMEYVNGTIDEADKASPKEDSPDAPDSAGILHFPSDANTGDLNDDNTEWLGKTHGETFSEITESMDKLGYAVVTMHPMEFASRSGTAYQNEADEAQIRELELLIDDIRDSGLRIVMISQINSGFVAIPEFSSYSILAILAASVVMTIWLSTRRAIDSWKND